MTQEDQCAFGRPSDTFATVLCLATWSRAHNWIIFRRLLHLCRKPKSFRAGHRPNVRIDLQKFIRNSQKMASNWPWIMDWMRYIWTRRNEFSHLAHSNSVIRTPDAAAASRNFQRYVCSHLVHHRWSSHISIKHTRIYLIHLPNFSHMSKAAK